MSESVSEWVGAGQQGLITDIADRQGIVNNGRETGRRGGPLSRDILGEKGVQDIQSKRAAQLVQDLPTKE